MILSGYQKLCLTSLSLIIGTAGIIALQNNNLQARTSAKEQTSYLQAEQALKAQIEIQKRTPTFGLNNLIADWNYLQFVQYFGAERQCCVSRELTKKFEENKRGSLQEVHDYFNEKAVKGEIVIVVQGKG